MNSGPTTEKERYLILDALRGLGLAGIALANYRKGVRSPV